MVAIREVAMVEQCILGNKMKGAEERNSENYNKQN